MEHSFQRIHHFPFSLYKKAYICNFSFISKRIFIYELFFKTDLFVVSAETGSLIAALSLNKFVSESRCPQIAAHVILRNDGIDDDRAFAGDALCCNSQFHSRVSLQSTTIIILIMANWRFVRGGTLRCVRAICARIRQFLYLEIIYFRLSKNLEHALGLNTCEMCYVTIGFFFITR